MSNSVYANKSHQDKISGILKKGMGIGGMMSAVYGREMRYCLIILCLVLLLTPAVAGVDAPAVTGITPATGSNATIISITNLAGTNFTSGATVMLTPSTVKPVHKSSISNALLSSPRSVYVSGTNAYVASYLSNALEIVDITNPAIAGSQGQLINRCWWRSPERSL